MPDLSGVVGRFFDPTGAWEAYCKVCYWTGHFATEPEASLAMSQHLCPSGRRSAGTVSRLKNQPMPEGRRSLTVCSQCDRPRVVMLNNVPFCEHHYEIERLNCTEHGWVLDSTEVFNTSSGPVIRAFYFCTICGIGVIAKPAESAAEAHLRQVREARESLLRAAHILEADDDG